MIVSTFPTHNKQYLKQPYRRFYRENSTDVIWTKINRAITLLDKGYRNFSASTPRSAHLSRRQKLHDAFMNWKTETFEVTRTYGSTYPKYERFQSRDIYSGRSKSDMDMDMPSHSPLSAYRVSDFLPRNPDLASRNFSSNEYRKFNEIEDAQRSINGYPESYLDDSQDDIGNHGEEKSDRSDVSYSPDVFFLEDDSLPKSTQALRERMGVSSSNSVSQAAPPYDDRRIQVTNTSHPVARNSIISAAGNKGYVDSQVGDEKSSKFNDASTTRSMQSASSDPTIAVLSQRQPAFSDFQSSRQQLKNSLQNIFNNRDDGLAEAVELSP